MTDAPYDANVSLVAQQRSLLEDKIIETSTPQLLTTLATSPTPSGPVIYLGTGGYSDTDMLGTLYPSGTKKSDFLEVYARQYGAVEINSTFYAPIGHKAFAGMLRKSANNIQFAVKLHQDFTHVYPSSAGYAQSLQRENTLIRVAPLQDPHSRLETGLSQKADHAKAFIEALSPIIDADRLASLLLQFPHGFKRTPTNRLYLAQLTDWFQDYPLAIEFRHPSWHIPKVMQHFEQRGLIWCSVDYPRVKGLPPSNLVLTQTQALNASSRTGYLRMHGNNLNWWGAKSASERHDYRYTLDEMQAWAQTIANKRQNFDTLYVFFQNSVKAHAYYNIAMLREALTALNLTVY